MSWIRRDWVWVEFDWEGHVSSIMGRSHADAATLNSMGWAQAYVQGYMLDGNQVKLQGAAMDFISDWFYVANDDVARDLEAAFYGKVES